MKELFLSATECT